MVLSTGYFVIHCIMQLDFLILNHGWWFILLIVLSNFWTTWPGWESNFEHTCKLCNRIFQALENSAIWVWSLLHSSLSTSHFLILFSFLGHEGNCFQPRKLASLKLCVIYALHPVFPNFSTTIKWKASAAIIAAVLAGLEIISRESANTMTGQIHFSSVTYCLWPAQFY